jgi:hypothetical protein
MEGLREANSEKDAEGQSSDVATANTETDQESDALVWTEMATE